MPLFRTWVKDWGADFFENTMWKGEVDIKAESQPTMKHNVLNDLILSTYPSMKTSGLQ